MAGGVVSHGVQRPGVIENIWGDLVEYVVGGADAEEFIYNMIDVRGLAEGPQNCRGVVTYQGRRSPGGGGADGAEDGLLEDQRRQSEVQVSDGAFWVGKTDQLLGDVV